MRKVLVLALSILLIASSAHAASEDVADGMGKKLIRGVVNIFTGIIEVPVQICKGYHKGFEPLGDGVASKTVGTVLGLFRGVGHAAGRTSWGALETFGFWTANPMDNEGVGLPLDAEYAWEEGTQYSIFEPNLGEGIKPIGRKIGRGLGNTFFGIFELPGQTMKGASDGNLGKGLVRGIWFWLSREVYGLGSLYSAIVPNPTDNPGYAFDHKWPWESLSQEVK